MRLPLALVALSLATLTEAQNFTSYVPECAPPCVEQALNSTKICSSIDDGECLCNNFSSVIFSSRTCFIETCNETNLGELRSNITTGWQKFCNDSGFLTESSTAWNPGGPDFPASRPLPTTGSSTTTTTSSPTASSQTEIADAPATSSSSDLGTAAKAGIGVGVGVGALAAIGGLMFLGFRLGQKKGREGDSFDTEGKSSAPSGDRATSCGGMKDGSGMASPSTAATAVAETDTKGGRDPWAYTESPSRDATLAELPSPTSPHVELPVRDLRELPVDERPVELWHGIMPPELSADAEVPRDRILGVMRS